MSPLDPDNRSWQTSADVLGGGPVLTPPKPKESNMTRNKYINVVAGAAAVPLLAIAAAACGSGSSAATPTTSAAPASSATPASPATGQPATVDVVTNPSLGTILVDSQGRTLYLFEKDSGTTSECSGACAVAWPPVLITGQATAGMDATGSLIGTTKRADGQTQVTYNGHPLYTFVQDQKAGDTNGEGVTAYGAKWYALSASGKEVTGPAAASGTSSGSGTSTGSGSSSSSDNGY
jgi:predicted lipoprotein with Yx(FWY)xxD motif